MSLGRIIRKKREQLHLTLSQVSGQVGFSKPYLSTIETEKVNNPPSDELLKKLERTLEFEQGLLLHIAHMERIPSDIRRQYESAEVQNQKMKQFIKNLILAKPAPAAMDKLLARIRLQIDNDGLSSAGPNMVPLISKANIDYLENSVDRDYFSAAADDFLRCPDLHDLKAFAVRLDDDSMEPKFHKGDIVVFSPSADVKSGGDCFICFGSARKTTFKRVFFEDNNMTRLQPRNEKYPPVIVRAEQITGLCRAVVKYEKL